MPPPFVSVAESFMPSAQLGDGTPAQVEWIRCAVAGAAKGTWRIAATRSLTPQAAVPPQIKVCGP